MTEQAYKALRDAIVSHQIRPGERLDTESIGASLGFSRAPVVDALNKLRAEGLVVSRRRVGTFASEIGSKQIEEVFDARVMIEQHVAPAVVRNVSDRQIDALGGILAQADQLYVGATAASFDYRRFMELDALFHSEIIRLSERTIYQDWFAQLEAHMQRVRHLYEGDALERSMSGQKEHEAILAALRQRDVQLFRQAMLDHTQRSQASSIETLEKQ